MHLRKFFHLHVQELVSNQRGFRHWGLSLLIRELGGPSLRWFGGSEPYKLLTRRPRLLLKGESIILKSYYHAALEIEIFVACKELGLDIMSHHPDHWSFDINALNPISMGNKTRRAVLV